MGILLGIDIGTSGTKTTLFRADGRAIASCTLEYPLQQPQNGWAEQDPLDWWHATRDGIRAVLAHSGISAADIRGIGLSGQMHSLVMLDMHGTVLRPAILWCDGRTVAECDEIHEVIGRERLIELTANPSLTGFTAGKLLWVRKHEPALYERCRHILLPKDYIRFRLTGEYATDVSDASGTGLFDVPRRCWSREVLDQLGIDRALLATTCESPQPTGQITMEAARETGLCVGTIVVGGAGDNAAAAVGAGVTQDGRALVTIGTSGVVYAHTDKLSIDPGGRVHTFCSAVPGTWHVMGVTLSAGASLQWFRNCFCAEERAEAAKRGVDPYEIMTAAAASAPIGANRLLFLPYLMGERTPHLDSHARGVFFGLSSMHGRGDLIRAVMEGVTYSLRDCMRILMDMRISSDALIVCGGGSASPFWRQMLADVLSCPVSTVAGKEGPSLGAALLAGVGTGLYSSVPEACRQIICPSEALHPLPTSTTQYDRAYAQYTALYPALRTSFDALAAI